MAGQSDSGGANLTPEERKELLVGAFTESLAKLGNYRFVAETTVLRPRKDRPLYCLCYATRHQRGIEVFRDCQIKALQEQSVTRATLKVQVPRPRPRARASYSNPCTKWGQTS